MNKLTVIRYTFLPYFSGYFQEGLWFDKDDKKIKERYYNGRVCIDVDGERYGVKKLRMFAKRNEVELSEFPF